MDTPSTNTLASKMFSRIVFFGTALFLIAVFREFFTIAWGSGVWLGEFSPKWAVGFIIFSAFLFAILGTLRLVFWKKETLAPLANQIITFREKKTFLRWLIVIILLILPVWFLQYTLWGLVFTGIYFRTLLWSLAALGIALFLTRDKTVLVTWQPLLVSILISAASFSLASVFANVTDYPFNLYWSDGNRLWDYSIMFGQDIYNYPADQPITAFISSGRQFLWGLPFLLPNTSILFNRFWSALVLSFPYMILGWLAFKTEKGRKTEQFLLGLLTFLFLNQGPIYTPLVLSAILVILVWESPLWLGIPVVAFAGYYAEITRFTWEFAPSIWAGMLELNKNARLTLRHWGRAISLALAGVSVWYLLPILQKSGSAGSEPSNVLTDFGDTVTGTVSSIQGSVSVQPLLWERLLPNDTYPEGIILGLLVAILPLSILLIYLARKKHWTPSLWQKLAMLGPLLVFLAVGIIISTKIGGGNNLHNLDMFLIALILVAAIAWKNGGSAWFTQSDASPFWIKASLLLLVALPALPSLRGIQPRLALTPAEIAQIQILTDYDPYTSPPIASLPADEEVERALNYISTTVEQADKKGEVLFIDARQLLTFGYVPQVRLVPEYEKKLLMNESMKNTPDYFSAYYQDLANHRFSLIVSEPLKVYIKDDSGSFAAENDVWTKWVAAPTLCYYEPLETFKSVYVQLLVPRAEPLDCSEYITQ